MEDNDVIIVEDEPEVQNSHNIQTDKPEASEQIDGYAEIEAVIGHRKPAPNFSESGFKIYLYESHCMTHYYDLLHKRSLEKD